MSADESLQRAEELARAAARRASTRSRRAPTGRRPRRGRRRPRGDRRAREGDRGRGPARARRPPMRAPDELRELVESSLADARAPPVARGARRSRCATRSEAAASGSGRCSASRRPRRPAAGPRTRSRPRSRSSSSTRSRSSTTTCPRSTTTTSGAAGRARTSRTARASRCSPATRCSPRRSGSRWRTTAPEPARELAEATLGMIGGQYLDITGADVALAELHALKTGRLFAAAVGLGLWAADVPEAAAGAVARVRRGARRALPGRRRRPRRRRLRVRAGRGRRARGRRRRGAGGRTSGSAPLAADTSVLAELVDGLAVRTSLGSPRAASVAASVESRSAEPCSGRFFRCPWKCDRSVGTTATSSRRSSTPASPPSSRRIGLRRPAPSQLEREPGEFIVDPWVRERATLVAVQRGRVVAGAHLCATRGETSAFLPRGRRIRWFLFWPERRRPARSRRRTRCSPPASRSSTGGARLAGTRTGPSRSPASTASPSSGRMSARRTRGPVRPRTEAAWRRSSWHASTSCRGRRATRSRARGDAHARDQRHPLSATLNGEVVGYVEVEILDEGERQARADRLADVGNLHVAEPHRVAGREVARGQSPTGCGSPASIASSRTPGRRRRARRPVPRGLRVPPPDPDGASWTRTPPGASGT